VIVPKNWRGPTIATEMNRFVSELHHELGSHLTIDRLDPATSSSGTSILVLKLTPSNPNALPIQIEIDHEFPRFTAGHNGGIWELHDDNFTTDLLQAMTLAVVYGHAEEVFGPRRSTVTLTLADGTTKTDTGIYGLLNMVTPRPGWRRRGRRVTYRSYA
jgi:hypothetical protein